MPELSVRFSPPAYSAKADGSESGNLADVALLGCFGDMPLQFAGFVVAKARSGSGLIVFMPKTAPLRSADPALQPARIPAPDGFETDSPDNTLPAPGGRQAIERYSAAVLTAWAECSRGGSPKWGAEYVLKLA